ncbi:hypothetical protein CHARACLAT_029422, partial [Characodon lateralis]|nr:hypothetical protein [Characodon lateralis]
DKQAEINHFLPPLHSVNVREKKGEKERESSSWRAGRITLRHLPGQVLSQTWERIHGNSLYDTDTQGGKDGSHQPGDVELDRKRLPLAAAVCG